jgi:DNA-binding NarL/FixJ family response regulator
VRAVAVAEHAMQANALALLLSTSPEVDVLAAEIRVENARATILRTRPDVVVLRSTDVSLGKFRSIFDLQLDMPEVGFVLVLENRSGCSARRAPVARAITVLPADFSLAELLTSVADVACGTMYTASEHCLASLTP